MERERQRHQADKILAPQYSTSVCDTFSREENWRQRTRRSSLYLYDIRVLGLVTIASGRPPGLASAAIASISVLGTLHASPAVEGRLRRPRPLKAPRRTKLEPRLDLNRTLTSNAARKFAPATKGQYYDRHQSPSVQRGIVGGNPPDRRRTGPLMQPRCLRRLLCSKTGTRWHRELPGSAGVRIDRSSHTSSLPRVRK